MDAFVIDGFEFCRLKERREGSFAIAELVRLSEELADRSGTLHWSLQGSVDALGHARLLLSVTATVQLMCQRCLTPFAFDVATASSLLLARNDDEADEIDAMLDEEGVDVIVGARAMAMLDLIEDEALLALPFSAKHPVCPDQVDLAEASGNVKLSPFAVLKGKQ